MLNVFKQRLYAYLMIYILIMGVVTLVLSSRHQTLTNNYIDSNVREFDQRIESYQSMQQKMIDNYHRLFLDSPEIAAIMKRAIDADPDTQERLRRDLMGQTGKIFATLQEYDVRLLFFHLPGAMAFLRVHEPEKFGDSLAKARPLIVHAQNEKQKNFAFETGKLFDGFRTVYPLFDHKSFVGTVEIAYPFLSLKKQALQQKQGAYTFLIKRSVQEAKARNEDMYRHYSQSSLGGSYLEDRESALLRDARGFDKGEIGSLIAANQTVIHKALAQGILQGVKLYNNDEYSLLILKPVYEFGGKHVAYMVELTDNHTFFEERIREFVLLWLSIAVLSALLMWYIYRYQRSTVFLEQYRDAIEKTMIVSRTDPKGIITYVNDRFTQVSGYTEKELLGKSHNIIRHPDTPASLFKELWETIKAGRIWRGELKNRTKEGDAYYVKSTIYPLVDENGAVVEYIGLREDVTELVEAAKKLEDEKRRFDTIFQHQKSIVVFTGREGGIEMVNRRFFDYFDFSDVESFLARYHCICEMFITRKGYLSAPTFAEFLVQLASSSEEHRKVLIRDKQGKERILAVEYAPITLNEGEYIIFSYHDITELDETLQREEQLRFQAQRSEAAKMEFLANMSHEIRTPLNGIMGFAKLLEKAGLAEEHRRQAKIISEQSKTLLGIINDILDLSKIESGHLELEKVLVNPFIEFEMAFSLYASIAQEKGIDYMVKLDSQISECIGLDSLRIKQVMGNLISNALKFTPAGGKIEVAVERIDAQKKPDKLRFSVTDSGIGIAPEKLQSIFSPFIQEDSSTTRQFGGTGLGLSISSKLVSLFGGELKVESEKGHGSRFWFEITVMECDPGSVLAMNLENSKIGVMYSASRHYHHVLSQLESFGIEYTRCDDKVLEAVARMDRQCDLLIAFEDDGVQRVLTDLPQQVGQIILIGKSERRYPENVHVIYDYESCPSKLYNALLAANVRGMHPASEGSPAQKQWHGKRVLVAEDYDVNRILIDALLKIHGIDPDFAENGKEAVEKVRLNRYDMVFMDVNMPGMDGLEATRLIRMDNQELPIIALTANALTGDRERFMNAGMNEHLTKPLDTDQLIRMLERFLGESSNEQEIPTAKPVKDEDIYAGALEFLKLPKEIILRLFDAFCSSLTVRLASLEQAVAEENLKEIEAQAHAIKGAAANLHLGVIRDLASQLENSSHDNTPLDYAMIVSRMRADFERIRSLHQGN